MNKIFKLVKFWRFFISVWTWVIPKISNCEPEAVNLPPNEKKLEIPTDYLEFKENPYLIKNVVNLNKIPKALVYIFTLFFSNYVFLQY